MSDPLDMATPRRLRLPAAIDRALSLAVVAGDSVETVRTKRLLTGALWISLPVSAGSALQLVLLGVSLAGAIVAASFVTSAGALLAMSQRPGTYPGVMHFVTFVNVLISSGLLLLFGGLVASGVNAVWGLVSVLGAIAVFADRRAVLWLVVYVVASVTAGVLATRIDPIYDFAYAEYVGLFNMLVVSVFAFFILYYYVRQRAFLLQQSDSLLRNVLPDEIAERLKTSGETIAESFESATILFADVAGFTPMSAEMSPRDLVALLDEVFTVFDEMVEERGLEKIKTIGDAYMVAGGVPRPRSDHAHAICDLALAIQEQIESKTFGGRRIRFRIGINSGPVVAGIIGREKFAYDLWGDAVNTASRMESYGSEGHIQITQPTFQLVEDLFVCEPKGTIEVKGKGRMPVWYLVGRRA